MAPIQTNNCQQLGSPHANEHVTDSPFYAKQLAKNLVEEKKKQLKPQAATAKELASRNHHLHRRLTELQNQEVRGEIEIQRRIDEQTAALQVAQNDLADLLQEYGPTAWKFLPTSLKVSDACQSMPANVVAVGSQSAKAEEADLVLQELLDDFWWASAELGCIKLPPGAADHEVVGAGPVAAAQHLIEEVKDVSASCVRNEAIIQNSAQALPELHSQLNEVKQRIADLTVKHSRQDAVRYQIKLKLLQQFQELKDMWENLDLQAGARYAQAYRSGKEMGKEAQEESKRSMYRRELMQEALHDLKVRISGDPQNKSGPWWRLWFHLKKETEMARKELEDLRHVMARSKLVRTNLNGTIAGLHRRCEALRREVTDQSSHTSQELQRWAAWAGKVEAHIVHAIAAIEVCTEGSCWNDPAALTRVRQEVEGLRSIKPISISAKLISEWEVLLSFVERELGVDHQIASAGAQNFLEEEEEEEEGEYGEEEEEEPSTIPLSNPSSGEHEEPSTTTHAEEVSSRRQIL